MPSFITIGCQGGGSETARVGRIKVPLYHALNQHVASTYCNAIDEYALVLRVDGSLATFGAEGIDRLRFAKKGRYITADIQMPEDCWKPLDDLQLRSYLSGQIRAAIVVCNARLKQDGFSVDEVALMSEVDEAIRQYTDENKENKPDMATPRKPSV